MFFTIKKYKNGEQHYKVNRKIMKLNVENIKALSKFFCIIVNTIK